MKELELTLTVRNNLLPTFLLRNRLAKSAAWRDLQAVMRHVGIPV